ncbi:hypothetical protein [Acinetobacter gyllenbergii]|uniref:hypothetical protein n=1 Tax=Acinetobacter gyllenbergii TaxID=134534 RepID=UPI003F55862F
MNIKNIALWFFGVTFILARFGAFLSSIVGAGLYILGGISLLPPAQRKLSSIIGKTIAVKWFVIFTLITMVIAPHIINADEQQALQNGTAPKDLIGRDARLAKQIEQE